MSPTMPTMVLVSTGYWKANIDPNLLAKGIFAGIETVCEAAAHERHRQRAVSVTRLEGPPTQQRDFQSLEIPRRHDPQSSCFPPGRAAVPLDPKNEHCSIDSIATHRTSKYRADGFDIGESPKTLLQVLEKTNDTIRFRIAGFRQCDTEGQNVVFVESEIDGAKLRKTLEKQPRSEQQNERQSDFGSEKCRSERRTAPSNRFRLDRYDEGRRRWRPRRRERRSEPENQRDTCNGHRA